MSVCRSERVRPRLAALALAGLLLGQTLAPCGILLSSVHAEELRLKGKKSAGQTPKNLIPDWATELEQRAAKQPREQKLRLAQLNRAGNDKQEPAEELDCLDCEVEMKPLDLSDVPTEKALRRAGAEDGALYPMRRGDAQELGIKLDRLLKRSGIEGGLRAELPPRDPRFTALKRGKERYERAKAINMLFGRAVKKWRGDERAQAVELFEQYLEKYPRSPWSGEAALHLGYAAKNGGRLSDATSVFQEVLEKTSDKPNKKLRQSKRERKARGGEITEAEREADVDNALDGVASVEEAIEKLDSAKASDDDDESFEIHMKAKQQLADIEIAMGHYNDASNKLVEIMEEDTDWRRRVWARKQLQRSNALSQSDRLQLSCGPQALGMVMVGLDKDAEAKKVKAAVSKNNRGFSMGELKTLAARNGVEMRGFRADVDHLSKIALPAILYYDYGNDSNSKASGHFVTLQSVDEKDQAVRIFDPLNKRSVRLSYAQMKRQWSGQGLAVGDRQVGAALDVQEMNAAVGSSTVNSSDLDMGQNDLNASVGVGDGINAPAVSVHQASLNVFAQHTVLGYQPPRGPAVDVTLSYNSDAETVNDYYNTSLGSKWKLNYASTGNVIYQYDPYGSGRPVNSFEVTMPDGTKRMYWTHWENGSAFSTLYKGVTGDFNYVEVMPNNSYDLVFPNGTRWHYERAINGSYFRLAKIIEPQGLSLTLGYFNMPAYNDILATITDADGRVTNFEYQHVGPYSHLKIKSITDPFGRKVQFAFDYNSEMMVQVIDAGGRTFNYAYDNLRDMVSLDLPRVNLTANPPQKAWRFKREYPDPNNSRSVRMTVTNPLDANEVYSYDNNNGRWFHVTPNRYTVPFNHYTSWQTHSGFGPNVVGRMVPTRINYTDGTYATYSFGNQHGLLSQIVDRQGQTTTYTYNGKGQIDSVTDRRGIKTFTQYASNGFDPIKFLQPKPDGSSHVVAQTVTYDDSRNPHQPTSITDINGTMTLTYTAWGAIDTTTDPQNRATRNVYNATAQLIAIEQSDAPVNGVRNWLKVAGFAYDTKSRVNATTDAANLTTTYLYNDLDNVTRTTYSDNTFDENIYQTGNGGLLIGTRDRVGRTSSVSYDDLGRTISARDAANQVTQMDYDANGNFTRLADTKGNITQWSYDTLDRPISKTFQNGTRETYNYQGLAANAAPTTRTGRLFYKTGTRGQNIFYHYDQNGNQTKIDYPNSPDITTSYNALDDVSVIADGTGIHNLGYDDYGRLISNDGPLANDTQTYSYDALERIQTQTLERGASGGVQSQTYTYDALGRLASLNSNGTQGTGLTTYTYDGNTDRLLQMVHPNRTEANLRYDGLGRLQHVYNGANGDQLHNRYSSNYDARDVKINTQSRTGSANPLTTTFYAYDALDQLKQERVVGGVAGTPYTTNYNYDAMGNRTQVNRTSATGSSTATSTSNALNQLTSLTTAVTGGPTSSSNLSYDAAGNLIQMQNTDGSKVAYGYDDADRLLRVEKYAAAGALLTVSQFAYDYADRRAITWEYDFANGGWANPIVTRRVFDGLDVVQERNASNQVTAQLVRDGGVGGILSRTTATGAAFYGYDGNANVTLLTDSAGQDVGRYRYDAFGNTLEAVGPRAGEDPYRFSTKEFHAQSGLYDYGFRFYSPGMGRWLNRDPLGEDGGVNLYGMVGNNPINAVDEYGLYPSPWEWWKGKVNDFLEPPKATPSNSDEAGADDYAAAENVAATTNHGRKTAAKAAAYGLEGYMAVLPGPKVRIPVAGLSKIPRGSQLYRSALSPYVRRGVNTGLTKAGRELSKHPGLVGLTKQSYGPTLRSDARKNLAAHNALKYIMRHGLRTYPYSSSYGGRIIQSRLPGSRYGARWYPNGKFIGFIGPRS